jgi:hypothetical protein
MSEASPTARSGHERVEVAASVVAEHDRLAVDQRLVHVEAANRVGDGREPIGEVSCSQPGPSGGRSTSAGSQGRMKPGQRGAWLQGRGIAQAPSGIYDFSPLHQTLPAHATHGVWRNKVKNRFNNTAKLSVLFLIVVNFCSGYFAYSQPIHRLKAKLPPHATVTTPIASQQSALNLQITQLDGQLKKDEAAIKALQERQSVPVEQAEYLQHLYNSRNDQSHSAITEEQAAYIKTLYENRADFKTLFAAEDTKLNAEDTKVNAKLAQADSDVKATVNGFEKNVTQEVADIRTWLWTNYFTVFGVLLTAMGLFALIGGILVRQMVLERVLEAANERIKHIIEGTAIYESYISIADAFYRLIHPIWELYEKDYQRFLRDQFLNAPGSSDKFIRDVRLAKLFARRGLAIVKENSVQERMNKHQRATCVYAALLNNFVYHETAEILCSPSAVILQDRVDKVLLDASECLKISKNEMLFDNAGTEWYTFHETVGTTFIRLGDGSVKREGRKIMADLFVGKTPGAKFKKPPIEWLQYIWDECFFMENGAHQDPLGLGNIPRP